MGKESVQKIWRLALHSYMHVCKKVKAFIEPVGARCIVPLYRHTGFGCRSLFFRAPPQKEHRNLAFAKLEVGSFLLNLLTDPLFLTEFYRLRRVFG
jgi:hypothetical protein